MSDNVADILLVGAGPMAIEYARVLAKMNKSFVVVGRGILSATAFEKTTGHKVITGSLESYMEKISSFPDYAIVATGVESLASNTELLVDKKINKILCEKPGGLEENQLVSIFDKCIKSKSSVFIAYNRRFYASVTKAKKIIEMDGGVKSFHFEFTEWSNKIEILHKGPGVKEKWFLSNSTHVADLAFYLGGKPKDLNCFTSGELTWHPSSSVFAGAGITEKGALFSYQANWDSPGRWSIEILTKYHRLIFRPLEELQVQEKESIIIEKIKISNDLDIMFKPGLYEMIDNFLENRTSQLCTLKEQIELFPIYNKIANYHNNTNE